MTFAAMHYFGIGLHKISLGALVLALGLLVDDAIIAVEMMVVKIEQGYDRIKAAAFAWDSTAFPMLTGTLVTAAGFLPIATAASSTGEYTRSIFQVVTIALLISWVAAVVFIPYLGYQLLESRAPRPRRRAASRARSAACAMPSPPVHRAHRASALRCPTTSRRNTITRPRTTLPVRVLPALPRLVAWCVEYPQDRDRGDRGGVHRLARVVPLRAAAVLPGLHAAGADGGHGAGRRRVAEGHRRRRRRSWKRCCEARIPGVESYVAYVGTGSPRFYLPLDQQLPAANFAQFVLLTHDIARAKPCANG